MARAADLFTQACKSGYSVSRTSAGDLLGSRNLPEAYKLYERAWHDGVGDVCMRLGDLMARGRRVKRNLSKAHGLGNRRVTLARPRGCTQLASSLQRASIGRPGFTTETDVGPTGAETLKLDAPDKVAAKVVSLYQRACTGGQVSACEWLANAYLRGEPVRTSERRSRALRERAGLHFVVALERRQRHALPGGGVAGTSPIAYIVIIAVRVQGTAGVHCDLSRLAAGRGAPLQPVAGLVVVAGD